MFEFTGRLIPIQIPANPEPDQDQDQANLEPDQDQDQDQDRGQWGLYATGTRFHYPPRYPRQRFKTWRNQVNKQGYCDFSQDLWLFLTHKS